MSENPIIETDVKRGSSGAPNEHLEAQKNAKRTVKKILKKVGKKISPRTKPIIPAGWVDMSEFIPDFLIDDDMFEQLTFRETLLISKLDETRSPIPVGALCLDIQMAKGGPYKDRHGPNFKNKSRKFLVHVSSELEHQQHMGGSRITAWVDRNLQTLEEKRREFIRRDGTSVEEKQIYVSTLGGCYYMRINKETDIYHPLEIAKNLICEGADFILLRYLAITRYIGQFEVTTNYINGDLCRNIYICKGPFSALVNNKRLDVCKIYRKILEKCGLVHFAATLLTLQGQILKQEWYQCDYVLQINPLADIKNAKPVGNLKIPLEKCFRSDLELMSRYLDMKCKTKKIIEIYLHDHREVRDMISDYVQTILQLKPDDVLDFTARYFLNYAPELIPRTEYFEPNTTEEASEEDIWTYL